MSQARRTVVLVTPPAIEPLTISDVHDYARIDTSDSDALITSFIGAARQEAENTTRRSLITQTLRLTLDLSPSAINDVLGEGVYDLPMMALYGDLPRTVELPRGPIQSITSIVTYDLYGTPSTYASSNYTLNADGSRMVLNFGVIWPPNLRPYQSVEITYKAGYGDTASTVPQAIRTAMLSHIMTMYDERAITGLPDGAARLLRPYRIMDGLAYG